MEANWFEAEFLHQDDQVPPAREAFETSRYVPVDVCITMQDQPAQRTPRVQADPVDVSKQRTFSLRKLQECCGGAFFHDAAKFGEQLRKVLSIA